MEYCSSWGGLPEANYVQKLLQTVYPKSHIKLDSPGHTANLVISLGGKEFFNRKKGGFKVHEKTATQFLEVVKTAAAKWSQHNQKD